MTTTLPLPAYRAAGGPRTILVVGATGARGGRVARHLLARGFRVRALTRDPTSAAARALSAAGAEPVAGDLAERASLRAALGGCWGAFGLVGAPEPSRGPADLGLNLVHAVSGSEIEHLVLGTPPGEPELETYARSLGVPATYLRGDLATCKALASLVAEIFERPGAFLGSTLGGEGAAALSAPALPS